MAKKIDGVIEAVRYNGSKVDVVRAYMRRGATYSDRVLLTRDELITAMKAKKRFVVGARKELLASTFETGKDVFYDQAKDCVSVGQPSQDRDLIESPLF